MVKESSRHRFWNLQWKFLCLQTLHTYIRLLIFRSILTLALKTTRLIAALLSKKIYFKLLQGCEDFRISNRTTQRRQEWPPNLHPWESATLSDLVLSGVLAILVFEPPAPIWLILTQLTTDEWVHKMYRQVKFWHLKKKL